MLRVVITVLKFLIRQIKGLTDEKAISEVFEGLKANKQIVYEAW